VHSYPNSCAQFSDISGKSAHLPCNGCITPSRFPPPLRPSFPVTYVVYYFPGFLSAPPPSLLRPSWAAAEFARRHLPFCLSSGHTPLSNQNCGWGVYTFRFRNLVLWFRLSVMVQYCVSIFWGFLGPKGNSGRRACCTILESVCD
jgi:hypothetical protein